MRTKDVALRAAGAGKLRAFVHEAMRHPERGGVFYASRALSECRRRQGTQLEPDADHGCELAHAELSRSPRLPQPVT